MKVCQRMWQDCTNQSGGKHDGIFLLQSVMAGYRAKQDILYKKLDIPFLSGIIFADPTFPRGLVMQHSREKVFLKKWCG